MKQERLREVAIHREKITEYLLNPAHPQGSAKARFFAQFGYTLKNWREFERALREIALNNPVAQVSESEYGSKISVDGVLKTDQDAGPGIRTVWILEPDAETPRLITAHPLGRLLSWSANTRRSYC